MHTLPSDWTSLCAVVFLLGMRHGLDADHLAAIDGLTRLNQRGRGAFTREPMAAFPSLDRVAPRLPRPP